MTTPFKLLGSLLAAVFAFTPVVMLGQISITGVDISDFKTQKAQVGFSAPPASFRALESQLVIKDNWTLTYTDSSTKRTTPIQILLATTNADLEIVELSFDSTELSPTFLTSEIRPGELKVVFHPLGSTLTGENTRASKGNYSFISTLTLTKDQKNADFDLAGSYQAGVRSKPQYQWSVTAAYPLTYRAFSIAPTFTGKASQEENADPDAMKASLILRFNHSTTPPPKPGVYQTIRGVILMGDALGYEFERNAKKEPKIVDGVAKDVPYQEKNTNLLGTGTVRYVYAWPQLNLTFGVIGFEGGKALTRSVRTTGTTIDSNQSIRRLKFDLDAYRTVYCANRSRRCLTFDGHYTLRLPFSPEPYKQTGVRGGAEFLTTKPRHYANANIGIPLSDGVNFSVKYLYGSLPPTFNFVDHQVTFGFEVFLKKKS